jgi:hypothetical protein
MITTSFSVSKVANGWTLRVNKEGTDGEYENDLFIATTAAKLKKMIVNAVNLIEKESNNAD